MIRYIGRRLWQMFPTVLGVIIITFVLFNLVGGSPAAMTLGQHVSAQRLEEFDEVRGFNKPVLFGWWSGTRAFATPNFNTHAGPWHDQDHATRHPAHLDDPAFLQLDADQTHALPLEFPLWPDTGYRWTIRYRLPAGGQAWFKYEAATDAEDDAEHPSAWRFSTSLPPTDDWTRLHIPFSTRSAPDQLHPVLVVEGAPLDIASIRLQRRADHFFDSQFTHYLGQIARLDLGNSSQTDQPVGQMLREGIGPSLTLTVPIFVVGLVVAVSLALVCAFFRNTWLDRFFVVISVGLMSVNYLVWIIVGQYLLAFRWGWFPVWGYESMAYLILPVIIGVISGLGTDLRFYRTVMLDEMYKDYVRTAFAKGVSRRKVLFKHVLRNAMITVTTHVVIAIPFLYTGSLLLESFFGIPGLGYMGINAINSSDVDVIRAIVLIGSILYVLANLITDISYAVIDPRVKLK